MLGKRWNPIPANNAADLSCSTVGTVMKDRILEHAKASTPIHAAVITKRRSAERMENLLLTWAVTINHTFLSAKSKPYASFEGKKKPMSLCEHF
jgi:hypothetical protein